MAAADRRSDTECIPSGLRTAETTLRLIALAWSFGEHPLRESLSSRCLMALAVMEMYCSGSFRAKRRFWRTGWSATAKAGPEAGTLHGACIPGAETSPGPNREAGANPVGAPSSPESSPNSVRTTVLRGGEGMAQLEKPNEEMAERRPPEQLLEASDGGCAARLEGGSGMGGARGAAAAWPAAVPLPLQRAEAEVALGAPAQARPAGSHAAAGKGHYEQTAAAEKGRKKGCRCHRVRRSPPGARAQACGS